MSVVLKRAIGTIVLFIAFLVGPGCGWAAPNLEVNRERTLYEMSRIWIAARLFHPWASTHVAAWDAAFAGALDRVSTDSSEGGVADAVQNWLSGLDDPITNEAFTRAKALTALNAAWTPQTVVRGPGVVEVDLGDAPEDLSLARDGVSAIAASLDSAQTVVVDLRPTAPGVISSTPAILVDRSDLLSRVGLAIQGSTQVRSKFYDGFSPEVGKTSGGYSSGFRYRDLALSLRHGESTRHVKLVFVVNQASGVPVSAVLLQREGAASIVSEDPHISIVESQAPSERFRIGKTSIRLRQGEVTWNYQPLYAAPNVTAPKGDVPRAIQEALAAWPPSAPPTVEEMAEQRVAEVNFMEVRLPGRGERLYGLFKTWWIFKLFYPYWENENNDWTGAVEKYVTEVDRATTVEEYVQSMSRMLSLTGDGHVGVYGPVWRQLFGATPAIAVKYVEGALVITEIGPASVLNGSDVRVGDIITAISGVPADEAAQRFRQFHSLATEANFRSRAASGLLSGPPNTTVDLRVMHRDGSEITVALARIEGPQNWRSHAMPPMTTLSKGIAYVDLTQIEATQVDAMFEKFRNAPAIIFDLRGYPKGTAWSIASRLTSEQQPRAARFDRVIVQEGAITGDSANVETFYQRIPATQKWRYLGLTILLIDENAVSQSEHTGLFLKAANKTTFVGSPTSGTDGDITNFRIPGGLLLTFTGQAVRWPDGSQLQRRGLQPDVAARPTIEGIREGKDEPLESALRFVERSLKANE